MPKYKKRKDGRYCSQIQTGFKDDGKPKYKTLYGKTIAELDKKIVEFRSDLYKGIIIENERMTLKEWAEYWVDTYKSGQSYTTYQSRKGIIDNHLEPIKNVKLSKLKSSHLQEFINIKSEEHNAENIATVLKEIFRQAVANDLIYKNPAENLIVPKREKLKRRALTKYELETIDKANLTDFERTFIYLCLYTGLRRGEALALMKSDIDLKTNIIKINKTLTATKSGNTIKSTTKTKAGVRDIPIVEPLKSQLKKYLSELKNLYLFTNRSGKIITNPSFDLIWKKIMKKLNSAAGGNDTLIKIKDLTPHYLRHTYATTLYYAGVDIKTSQYLMGHTNVKMTIDLYTHLDKDNKSAAEKLQSYINSNQSKFSQNKISI